MCECRQADTLPGVRSAGQANHTRSSGCGNGPLVQGGRPAHGIPERPRSQRQIFPDSECRPAYSRETLIRNLGASQRALFLVQSACTSPQIHRHRYRRHYRHGARARPVAGRRLRGGSITSPGVKPDRREFRSWSSWTVVREIDQQRPWFKQTPRNAPPVDRAPICWRLRKRHSRARRFAGSGLESPVHYSKTFTSPASTTLQVSVGTRHELSRESPDRTNCHVRTSGMTRKPASRTFASLLRSYQRTAPRGR